MQFEPTRLPGAYFIKGTPQRDSRGWFARAFCIDEFRSAGLSFTSAQSNLAYSSRKATLRGMHWQAPPYSETKIVRCLRGAIHDVIIDLRSGSSTYGQWQSFRLGEEIYDGLFVPPGFAHGYMTLTEDTLLSYDVDAPYAPECQRGLRWDDPSFAIDWPFSPTEISDRDRDFPDFSK